MSETLYIFGSIFGTVISFISLRDTIRNDTSKIKTYRTLYHLSFYKSTDRPITCLTSIRITTKESE